MRWENVQASAEIVNRIRHTWRDNSAAEIARCLRAGILAPGFPLEIWRVNGSSFLVTETLGDCIFVWAYEGRDAVLMMEDLIRIARKNEIRVIRYSTDRRGFLRMFRKFEPVRIESDVAENVFEIEVTQ